jgi:hypothetical protein
MGLQIETRRFRDCRRQRREKRDGQRQNDGGKAGCQRR